MTDYIENAAVLEAILDDHTLNNIENEPGLVTTTNTKEEAFFSPLEARVIAALMEKNLTTPKYYPLTMNSLTNACNQKNNREPVMGLTEGQVGHTVNLLVDRKLASLEYGDRANKVSHHVTLQLDIDRKQQAIMTVLMLRAPQTLNDIKTRTARMAEFEGLEDIEDTLNNLMHRDKPLAVLIPKGVGRREDRYSHTLCGEVDLGSQQKETMTRKALPIENDRMNELEARVAYLEKKLGITSEVA